MPVFLPARAPQYETKTSRHPRWSEEQIMKKARKMARSLTTTEEEREALANKIAWKIARTGREDLDEMKEELKREIREERELKEKERQASAAAKAKEKEKERQATADEAKEEDALYKAICNNNWEDAKTLIEKEPNALTSKITASGKTPFHVAALFGQVGIMKELVKKLRDPDFLETVDDFGNTPLLIATVTGSIQVANCLVNKNSNLLTIPNSTDELPTTLAFLSGHHEMGRHLYYKTPLECLRPHRDRPPLGSTLLHCCFQTQCFDITRRLLSKCPELLFASADEDWKPIYGIASMNSTIPSPSELVFWKRWIYYYIIDKDSTSSFESDSLPIQRVHTRGRGQGRHARRVAAAHRLLQWLISSASNLIGIRRMKELKLLQAEADEIVHLVYKNASNRDQVNNFADALFRAAKAGNVKFVIQISKANPELLLIGDKSYRNIFYHAIEHRQAMVFNLIHGLRFKDVVASSRDLYGNSLLHAVARRAPSPFLNRIYGPTLEMQRELQWFKEVEKLIPTTIKKAQNHKGMTAEELFKDEHEELRKEGEKWIKATAKSCSLVGTLIVTIMFATAFTVPGGNDQSHGFPLLIKQSFFTVFIFSTIISLISSSTSVLTFLAILTSDFSQNKFLRYLSMMLILGLSSLLISIVSMMVAFLSTMRLTLKHTNYSWGLLPVIVLASVPVSLFVLSQFPLLRHTAFATCGSIFNEKVEKWP